MYIKPNTCVFGTFRYANKLTITKSFFFWIIQNGVHFGIITKLHD